MWAEWVETQPKPVCCGAEELIWQQQKIVSTNKRRNRKLKVNNFLQNKKKIKITTVSLPSVGGRSWHFLSYHLASIHLLKYLTLFPVSLFGLTHPFLLVLFTALVIHKRDKSCTWIQAKYCKSYAFSIFFTPRLSVFFCPTLFGLVVFPTNNVHSLAFFIHFKYLEPGNERQGWQVRRYACT